MKRDPTFMDWKTWYYDSNMPQSNVHIQCNSYQNPNNLFDRNRKADQKKYSKLLWPWI